MGALAMTKILRNKIIIITVILIIVAAVVICIDDYGRIFGGALKLIAMILSGR